MAREFYLATPAGNGFYLERVEQQPTIGNILHEQVEVSVDPGLSGTVSFPLGVDFESYNFIVAQWYLGIPNTAMLDGFTFSADSDGDAILLIHLAGGVTGIGAYVNVIALSKELF